MLLPFSAEARRPLRVLSIGNSYSTDALGYLPQLLEELAPDVDLTLGIAFRGSFTLQKHWERGVEESAVYERMYKYSTSVGCWYEEVAPWSFGLRYAVISEPWDIVVLQEGSANSRDYNLYQPYLDNLVGWIDSLAVQPVELGWLLTPAYPDGSQYADTTSRAMMSDIMSAAQQVMTDTRATILLPCGTALENARTTSLDSLGRFGHLSYDGLHLQEGVACMTESYAAAIALLEHLGIAYDLRDDTLAIDRHWLMATCKPATHGDPVGLDLSGARSMAMHCALQAVQQPFAVADMAAAEADSKLADTCYVHRLALVAGETDSVPLLLFNNEPLVAVEADLAVPNRLPVPRRGKHYAIAPTWRTAGEQQSVFIRWSQKNLYHISLTASADEPITANSGAVAWLFFNPSVNYPGHVYAELKNITITDTQSITRQLSGGKIAVDIYRRGDVNRDDRVDVSDLNLLVSAALGLNAEGLWTHGADLNRDGSLDVADVNALINVLLQ